MRSEPNRLATYAIGLQDLLTLLIHHAKQTLEHDQAVVNTCNGPPIASTHVAQMGSCSTLCILLARRSDKRTAGPEVVVTRGGTALLNLRNGTRCCATYGRWGLSKRPDTLLQTAIIVKAWGKRVESW